jgi:5'-nucleotidase
VKGLEFRSGIAEIDRWVPQLRAQGADFVIVVAHSGAVCDRDFKKCDGEIIEWARGVKHKPDLIVAGHTHRLVRYVENGIPIVEANSYSTRYGVVDLHKDSTSTRAWIRDFPTTYVDRVKGDDQIIRLVQRYEREIGPQVSRVVATLGDTLIKGTNTADGGLGNLLADAFRTIGEAQIAFVNNGSIRIAELPKGPVTWGQLYSLQPFENRMVRLTMTGAQIRAMVERTVAGQFPGMHVGGLTVTYAPAAATGSRVRRILVEGQELQDAANYSVAVTDFLATGGDAYAGFTQASKREDIGLTDLEALIEYLQKQPQPVRVNASERRYITQ